MVRGGRGCAKNGPSPTLARPKQPRCLLDSVCGKALWNRPWRAGLGQIKRSKARPIGAASFPHRVFAVVSITPYEYFVVAPIAWLHLSPKNYAVTFLTHTTYMYSFVPTHAESPQESPPRRTNIARPNWARWPAKTKGQGNGDPRNWGRSVAQSWLGLSASLIHAGTLCGAP